MPNLGSTQNWGNQTRVFTHRGWVVVDDHNELDEELRQIETINKQTRSENGSNEKEAAEQEGLIEGNGEAKGGGFEFTDRPD